MGFRSILLLLATLCSLQGELLPIRSFTVSDGLAADHIDCIFADSRGLLWFGTPEGLSRFDGYGFVNYGVADGLPHPAVSTVMESRAGDLLVGTARGLSWIGGATGKGRFTADTPAGPIGARNPVVAVREARSGGLWIATPREVLEWRGPGKALPRPLRPGPILIQCLLEDPRAGLLIGTSTGLLALYADGGTQTFTAANGLPGDWINTMLLDSGGHLWAGTRGGLALLSSDNRGHWRLEQTYTRESGLAGLEVNALLEASSGTLWVGTASGVSLLRPAIHGWKVLQNLTRAQGLVGRSISALAEDPAGNIWLGTEGAGAMRIDRGGFTTYGEADGLRSDDVRAIPIDRAGQLLAITGATDNKRFSRSIDIFDGARFHSIYPGVFAENPSWGWNQIVLQSRSGEWWAATNRGLCRFRAMEAAEWNGAAPLECYAGGVIFRIFEDSQGGIWASGQSVPIEKGDRLMRWDPGTQTMVDYPPPRIPGGPVLDLVAAFAEDPKGNIWMGLYTDGLYRYDGRGFQHFGQKDGVPSGIVLALLSSTSGLWVGSYGGGLARLPDPEATSPHVETFGAAQGLSSNIVTCLTEDREGRIYACTGKGVDRLDPKTGHIRHFTTSNGLAHGELRSATRDSSGALWFATNQGLSRLAPDSDRTPPAPRILITDVRSGSKSYPLSLLGESHISRIELDPSQNQLQVEFAGIGYEPGDSLRYSYLLDGADTQWSPPRAEHSVNYAALASGRFRFFVKAVTSDGVESPSAAEIDFTVLPPVWRRWWFEGLVLALTAAAIYTAYRYRVAQIVALERVRTTIATDLHDDIGASLSQIAILSEAARTSVDGQAPRERLERVASLARELVDSMGDIVWSIRTEPRGMESLPSRMRDFALDFLTAKGIDFTLRVAPDWDKSPLGLQERRQMFLMFKECVHNAARHSRCTAIAAELKTSGDEIELAVEDNGAGIDPQSIPAGGTGIAGMRRRAESLGGRMQLISDEGRGCRVTIRIPARRRILFGRAR